MCHWEGEGNIVGIDQTGMLLIESSVLFHCLLNLIIIIIIMAEMAVV